MDSDLDLPLVRALQGGDDRALNELMARHKEGVHRFLYRCVGREEEAGELAQECFVRVYFRIGQFRPTARFSTWLYQIALNLARDYLRSRRHRQERLTSPLAAGANGEPGESGEERELPAPGADPAGNLERQERLDAVRAAIAGLPEPLREALVLTALEEKSHHDAAAILKTSPKTIEMRVYRARKALAERLAPWLSGGL